MKILLIDDKADKGWRQLLEKVFPVSGISFDTAVDIDTAFEKIETKYDLIFLDVRLNSKDHSHKKVEDFSGFKILEQIKKKFLNQNFSTPIILITASNKIWNINKFLDYSVDSYYIKEHPDHVFDKKTSKQNYDNFKDNFKKLSEISPKRKDVWSISKDIINKLKGHKYFKQDATYVNVRKRIIDKIKLGYYYSFKDQNSNEKKVLKADNEAIAFLIYFSILEELIKGYTAKNTWDLKGEFLGNWKFRNKGNFIQTDYNSLEVEPIWDGRKYNSKKLKINDKLYKKYFEGKINLSEQVNALIYHYGVKHDYKSSFEALNKFRNKLSYTHSSINAIYNKSLIDVELKSDFYNNILEMLELINEILDYPK